jgi:hypothetical protein
VLLLHRCLKQVIAVNIIEERHVGMQRSC